MNPPLWFIESQYDDTADVAEVKNNVTAVFSGGHDDVISAIC